MKKALIFLTTGFEEIEALATVDILKRGGVEIKTVSLTETKIVKSSHGVQVVADLMFKEAGFTTADILIIPGGTSKYNEHDGLKREVKEFFNKGKIIAAICAAPMVLGGLGILKGKKATCYPGYEKYLEGAILETDKAVVVDGNVITGKGPGLTFDFAFQILETLEGKSKKNEVAEALLLQ